MFRLKHQRGSRLISLGSLTIGSKEQGQYLLCGRTFQDQYQIWEQSSLSAQGINDCTSAFSPSLVPRENIVLGGNSLSVLKHIASYAAWYNAEVSPAYYCSRLNFPQRPHLPSKRISRRPNPLVPWPAPPPTPVLLLEK
ncbi:2-methylcitrate synthase [Venturia inaequalis]|nr:2-methylcitrate synthase [Venturia inaequalis]